MRAKAFFMQQKAFIDAKGNNSIFFHKKNQKDLIF